MDFLDAIVDPRLNKFAVGHINYTDYGDVMANRSKGSAFSIARDIGGWDTRFNAFMRELELMVVSDSYSTHHKTILGSLWSIYSNALLEMTRPKSYFLDLLDTGMDGKLIVPTNGRSEVCKSSNTKISGER